MLPFKFLVGSSLLALSGYSWIRSMLLARQRRIGREHTEYVLASILLACAAWMSLYLR